MAKRIPVNHLLSYRAAVIYKYPHDQLIVVFAITQFKLKELTLFIYLNPQGFVAIFKL